MSARKLLKHPWIVNARRSDSVVPKKPTEYDEAVKSVQRWNEALKSPNAGSLRRASRPLSSSPVPFRRDLPPVLATPVKGPLNLAKPQYITEQFRSPDNTADDNWDDDFASAISPDALQLPHLKPHDNFGGLLSSEKLKSYASFETVTEETNWDDNFEGDLTTRRPLSPSESDPLQTIRPYYPKRTNTDKVQTSAVSRSAEPKKLLKSSRHVGITSNLYQKQTPAKQRSNFNSSKPNSDMFLEHGSSPAMSQHISSDSRVMVKKVWRWCIQVKFQLRLCDNRELTRSH